MNCPQGIVGSPDQIHDILNSKNNGFYNIILIYILTASAAFIFSIAVNFLLYKRKTKIRRTKKIDANPHKRISFSIMNSFIFLNMIILLSQPFTTSLNRNKISFFNDLLALGRKRESCCNSVRLAPMGESLNSRTASPGVFISARSSSR